MNALAESGGGWATMNATRHDLDLSGLHGKTFAKWSFILNAQRGNILPHAALNGKTPFSILYPDKTPPLHLFKIFGCKATFLKKDHELRNKTEPRGTDGIYLGTALPLRQTGYLIWDINARQIVTVEHAEFDEGFFPARPAQDQRPENLLAASPTGWHNIAEPPPPENSVPLVPPVIVEEEVPDLIAESDESDDEEETHSVSPSPPPVTVPISASAEPHDHGAEPYAEIQPVAPQQIERVMPESQYWDEYSLNHGTPDKKNSPSSFEIGDHNATTRGTRSGRQYLLGNKTSVIVHGEQKQYEDFLKTWSTSTEATSLFNWWATTKSGKSAILNRHINAIEQDTTSTLRAMLTALKPMLPNISNLHRKQSTATIAQARHISAHGPSKTTFKKPGIDIIAGEHVDLTGYTTLGAHEISAEGTISDSFITRTLVRALKVMAHENPESRKEAASNIALLRNPKTVKQALSSPQRAEWIEAIRKELQSLIDKGVYEVKPAPKDRKPIPTRLVLKIKLNADGTIDKFKARCVVAGYRQQAGLDYDPNGCYSPMTEASTIRLLLSLANSLDLEIDHLDIKTAFLNGVLPEQERFWCSPPPGAPEEFLPPPGHAWHMAKGLYGAHQSGAIWSKTWRSWTKEHASEFHEAGNERCVYVMRQDADGKPINLERAEGIKLDPKEKLIIIVMNTDDLLIMYTKNARTHVDEFEQKINQIFEATPRQPVEQYLGMHVARDRIKRLLTIDARRHVYDYITMMGFDPHSGTSVSTPLDPHEVYTKADCPEHLDMRLRERVWKAHGTLIHLAVWARPDLAHAVSVLGRYIHNPAHKHWLAYERIAKYLIKTKDFRLVYGSGDTYGLEGEPYGMSDSDWGGNIDDRRSTGAYVFFLDGAGVSWKVKLSPTICLSTQEAEYVALSEAVKEALNICMLMRDLGFGTRTPTKLFCDNKGAITMSVHPANKPATRHMDMRIHNCRHHVEAGNVETLFESTQNMTADFMSKQTPKPTHERHVARAMGNQAAPIPLADIHRLVH